MSTITLPYRYKVVIPRLIIDSHVKGAIDALTELAGGVSRYGVDGEWFDQTGRLHTDPNFEYHWWFQSLNDTTQQRFSDLLTKVLARGEQSVFYTITGPDSWGNDREIAFIMS